MTAEGILDGSVLVVDRSIAPKAGRLAVVDDGRRVRRRTSAPAGTRCRGRRGVRDEVSVMFALVDGNSFYASCEQVFDLDAASRPVVVLSNNDGCVVAASKSAKALGCEMFKPYFQIKQQLCGHNVKVFSSNYTLYDDIQRRLVTLYRQHAEEVEIYSIDEAFLTRGAASVDELAEWGDRVRRTAKQWTGISTGVGIAQSKLLSKLANHCSKRDPIAGMPEGVAVLTDLKSSTTPWAVSNSATCGECLAGASTALLGWVLPRRDSFGMLTPAESVNT